MEGRIFIRFYEPGTKYWWRRWVSGIRREWIPESWTDDRESPFQTCQPNWNSMRVIWWVRKREPIRGSRGKAPGGGSGGYASMKLTPVWKIGLNLDSKLLPIFYNGTKFNSNCNVQIFSICTFFKQISEPLTFKTRPWNENKNSVNICSFYFSYVIFLPKIPMLFFFTKDTELTYNILLNRRMS